MRQWVEERLEARLSEAMAETIWELGDVLNEQGEQTANAFDRLTRELRDLRDATGDLRALVRADLRASSSPIDLPNPSAAVKRPN